MGRVRSKTRRMSYVSTVNRQQRQSYVICHVTFETLKLEPYIVTTTVCRAFTCRFCIFLLKDVRAYCSAQVSAHRKVDKWCLGIY